MKNNIFVMKYIKMYEDFKSKNEKLDLSDNIINGK